MKIRILAMTAVLAAVALPALAQPADGAPPAGAGAGPRDPAARFAAMDTNKDGTISKDEWVAAGRREQGFDRIDANHDGKITPEEMAAARPARRGGGGGGGAPPAPAQ
jgi:hypothetical protein